MTSRSFLLLQGVATPFFPELGKGLKQAGHQVLHINFGGGDLLSGHFFSVTPNHINYKGSLEGLADFYNEIVTLHNITDILLFGDTRPIHLPILEYAKQNNIRVYVFEEGYLRPNWVTLDKGGVNANSSLSKDPEWYLKYIKTHKGNKIVSKAVGGGLAIRVWHDIRYHFANLLLSPLFPHYQSHRPERALKEYWGWIKRMPMLWLYYNKKSEQQIKNIISTNKPFYLLPLQLDADSQIRVHSTVKNLTEVISKTVESFATHAPKESLLVIKIHPLDPWFVNFPAVIKESAEVHKVSQKRIIYLESGDLITLLKKAKGTVLVNSTVGTSALSYNCPVIALGSAIYDMPKLTFQGSLDMFWTHSKPPNKKLFKAFQQTIINKTQINGGYYNQKGIEMAVAGSLAYFDQEGFTSQSDEIINAQPNNYSTTPAS